MSSPEEGRLPLQEATGSLPGGAEQEALTSELAREVARLASSERELRELLRDAHAQIAARDEELARLHTDNERLFGEAKGAHDHLAAVKRTRVWRVGTTFWAIRDFLLRRRTARR